MTYADLKAKANEAFLRVRTVEIDVHHPRRDTDLMQDCAAAREAVEELMQLIDEMETCDLSEATRKGLGCDA